MNIPSNLDKLHSFYGKAKYAFLAVFALTIMFSAFVSHRAYGDSVVGTVETKIVLAIDGKTKNITTTQNTIGGALSQNGINLTKNDITEPPADTYLSGKTQDVSVVRAVPVLIDDNGQSWAGVSAYTQPQDILKQLKVEMFPEDKVSADLIMDPVMMGAVGQEIFIKRAPVYTVYVDDTTKVVRSWAKKVADLLAEKGISMGANDTVDPGKTALLTGVTELTITRINYADTEETIAIPYQTINQKDNSMYEGKSAVTQDGMNGSKKQSLHIVYKNGIEVERTVTATVVLQVAQNKIVSIGAKPYGIDDLWPILVAAGSRYGIDPGKMVRVMFCESGAHQYSGQYGQYQGLFQWDKDSSLYGQYSSRAGYPGVGIFDVYGQIYATALRVSESGGWAAWGQCQYK